MIITIVSQKYIATRISFYSFLIYSVRPLWYIVNLIFVFVLHPKCSYFSMFFAWLMVLNALHFIYVQNNFFSLELGFFSLTQAFFSRVPKTIIVIFLVLFETNVYSWYILTCACVIHRGSAAPSSRWSS